MGLSYSAYTYPLEDLTQLAKNTGENAEKIVRVLFRDAIKDRETRVFLAGEIKKLGSGCINIQSVQTFLQLLPKFNEYKRLLGQYSQWAECRERKELHKNRHRLNELYTRAPREFAERLQQKINEAQKIDQDELFVPTSIKTRTDGKEVDVGFDYSIKDGKVTELKLFHNPDDQKLYENLKKWEEREKEWRKYKQWFDTKEKWLQKHGLNNRTLKIAERISKALKAKELQGSFAQSIDFFSSEFEELFEFLASIEKYSEPSEKWAKQFKTREDSEVTLIVLNRKEISREAIPKLAARFSGKIRMIAKNIAKYGDNAIISEPFY
ncbi:hypothetical protein HYV85_06175 [Candidatus Woesearchaeota archaeon]|nr:hypothetical protein [Candidatus Woesearchaeota archaeon]